MRVPWLSRFLDERAQVAEFNAKKAEVELRSVIAQREHVESVTREAKQQRRLNGFSQLILDSVGKKRN